MLPTMRFFLIALAIFLLAQLFGGEHPIIELFVHFWPYVCLASLILVGFSLLYGRYRLFSLFLSIATLVPWISTNWPAPKKQEEFRETISILQFNLFCGNRSIHPFVDHMMHKGLPDIMVLQEVTPRMMQQLKPLQEQYPHHFAAPLYDSQGMMIMSRLPIQNVSRHTCLKSGVQYTMFWLETLARKDPLLLVELHTSSPLRGFRECHRKWELSDVAQAMADQASKAPYRILIGDLNTTPYSPYFRKLVRRSGLNNAMRGIRLTGTWHTRLPCYFRIPIDHLLISDTLQVRKQEVLSAFGSDHSPVLSYVELK